MGVILGDLVNGSNEVLFEKVANRVETQSVGYHEVTLTEFGTSVVPQIAAGSKIEIDGAIGEVKTTESITGSPSDGTVYIKTVPTETTFSFAWTNVAPTWSDEKQGWYSAVVGQENYRYLEFSMTKSGTDYLNKQYDYVDQSGARIIRAEDATERTTTSATYVTEANLSLTIPIKTNEIWEIKLLVDMKSSSGSARARSIITSGTSVLAYGGDGSLGTASSENMTSLKMVDTSYSSLTYLLQNSVLFGATEENVVVQMQFLATGTTSVRNRVLIAKRIV